jgi:hypothetical protein
MKRSHAFSRLCKDEISIVKPHGAKVGPYSCALSPNQVTIFDGSIDVDEGDTVMRELPNGKAETYTILEVHFSPGLHQIPPHYDLKIRKDSSLVAQEKSRITHFHITNSHGFQIGDHNVQHIINSLGTLIGQIDASDAPEAEKDEAKSRLKSFLEHPLVCAVLGGAAGGISGLLSGN